MRKHRRLILAVLILVAAILWEIKPSHTAANHYIRAGASGANSGTDWTNAWTSLSAVTWTRGDVYYIAGGSYSGVTVSTALSGSSVIEIRAAVGGSGDHGTSTGWSDGYQSQAIISQMTFDTGYWTLNGQSVPGCAYPGTTASCFLIKCTNTSIHGQCLWFGGSSAETDHMTVEFVEVQGSNVHTDGADDEGILCTPGPCNNTYIGSSWVHNVGCDNLSFNENLGNTITIEYSWISYNNYGPTTAAHCQGIQSTFATMIIRYNMWQDMQSSAAISLAAGGGGAPITSWEIYGNDFFWDATWTAAWSGDGRVGYDDGIVGIFDMSAPFTGTLKMYNNTEWGLGLPSPQNCNGQWYTINGGESFSTVLIENNLTASFGNSNCNAGSAGAGTYDYNAYYQISNSTKDSGTHTTSSASAAPLVNPSASTVAGFKLSGNTSAGTSLAAPYNTDLFGTTRGANGTWDRGFFQIAGVGGTYVPPVTAINP